MTGFAQVKGQVTAQLAFALSLKSVNHRFLDLHFRLPSDTDALEMKLRRMLKEKMARGHVEVILNLDRSGTNGVALNRQLIAGYVEAFRAAADEFGVEGEPDLNVVLRMPGAMDAGASARAACDQPREQAPRSPRHRARVGWFPPGSRPLVAPMGTVRAEPVRGGRHRECVPRRVERSPIWDGGRISPLRVGLRLRR